MADTSASPVPPDRQSPVAVQLESARGSSCSNTYTDSRTTFVSDEKTKGKASTELQSTPDSNRTRDRKKTFIESVDTSDEDSDKTNASDYLPSTSTTSSASPGKPQRKRGNRQVRHSTQSRDEANWIFPPGSTGGLSYLYANYPDSDSDSNTPVHDFPPDFFAEELNETSTEEMGVWEDLLHIDQPDDSDIETEGDGHIAPTEESLYPQGLLVTTECYVCFEETILRRRLCCDFPVCDGCLESYLMVQVLQANVKIECLNINCNSYIHRNEISARLPAKYKTKFYKFLIDANMDPTVKTCPRCSSGQQVDKADLKKRKVVKNGLPVTCQRCGLEWCFTCHAPLHKGLSCKEFRKGDILLKEWAREFHYGQLNAQQCPKCKIFIQRSLGCDHMMCTRCHTNFCYRCGENYHEIKLFGNHFSRYSPFGCKYNFMPESPHMRRLVRGAVLGGKILGGLVLSGFVVAAGAVLLGMSVIFLPAWGSYKLHQRRILRQRLTAKRKYMKKQAMAQRNLEARDTHNMSRLKAPSLSVIPEVLESSDSLGDDSSDEVRDHLMVGLQLPDSQRVEVLVHHTISSSSDQEDGNGANEGAGLRETREVVTDSAIIVTDLQEVVDEQGYKKLITSINSKSTGRTACVIAPILGGCDNDSDVSLSEDERFCTHTTPRCMCDLSSMNCSATCGTENQSGVGSKSQHADDSDIEKEDQLSLFFARVVDCGPDDQGSLHTKQHVTHKKETEPTPEKRSEEKEGNIAKEKKDKSSENTEKGEKKLTEKKDKSSDTSEKGDKKATDSEPCTEKEKDKLSDGLEKKADKDSCPGKPADQKDSEELSKESTNGCFGNIFSKKITVIQIGGKRNTETQPDTQKATNACFKSSTWEKGRSKSSSQHKHKASMDIQDPSHFREKHPVQLSDICVKPSYDKGLLLQDFVVLSPPGDFGFGERVARVKSSDSLSLASASSMEEDGGKEKERCGEGSSCCCLSGSDSLRGSNLSCDIVTYL